MSLRMLTLLLAATATFQAVAAEVVPKPIANELAVDLIQNQQEIVVDGPAQGGAMAAGMQYGLVGALIGAAVDSGIAHSRNKAAEEKIAAVRDVLVDFDFNARLEQALRAKLASAGNISPNPRLTVVTAELAAARDAGQVELAPQALVLEPHYGFDGDMFALYVRLRATIEVRVRSSSGRYSTSRAGAPRSYTFRFPLAQPHKPTNPATWAAQGKAGLSAALEQGIDQVTDMLVFDFSDEGRAQWTAKTGRQFTPVGYRRYPGLKIRGNDTWAWGRTNSVLGREIIGYQPVLGPIDAAMASLRANAAPGAAASGDTTMPQAAATATGAGGDVAPGGAQAGKVPEEG